jgi:glycerol-3-phosphate acyltransferase PlsY
VTERVILDYVILVLTGYLLGSVPFGVVLGWAVRRIDVREHGSGNTGMTNVLRTVGRPAAALVLLLDMGKGVASVVLARAVSDTAGVESAAALAALAGHNWPVFLGFRGGRGTATGWGALLVLSPISGLVATVVGTSLVATTRYMSLGSIGAATLGTGTLVVLSLSGLPPGYAWADAPLGYVWFGAIGGSLVVARHRDNIERLLKGEERKVGQPSEDGDSCPGHDRGKGLRWPRSA